MRRPLLDERIAWLDTFPKRMTVGALLKALRIVANAAAQQPQRRNVIEGNVALGNFAQSIDTKEA